MSIQMVAIYLVSGMSVMSANFIYQYFRFFPDWSAAIERSWFQGVALLAVGLSLVLRSINQ